MAVWKTGGRRCCGRTVYLFPFDKTLYSDNITHIRNRGIEWKVIFFFLSIRIQTLFFFTEDSFLGRLYIYWALEILWPYMITVSTGLVDTCLTVSCLALNLKMI